MATRAKAKQAQNGGEGREQTRRVVLQRAQVIVLPVALDVDAEDVADGVRSALAAAEGVMPGAYLASQAWLEIGQAVGTKVQAIETHAGKPGTPDAKVGEFKAVPVRGWQGGARYEAPPAPLVQRRILEG